MTHPWVNPSCTSCGLHETAENVCIRPRGSVRAPIFLVGEAPGKNENQQGKAFVGRAGDMLLDLLAAAHYEDGQFRLTNVVRCIPWEGEPGWNGKVRRPSPAELAACQQYINSEIVLLKPEVIVALGNSACEAILGKKSVGAIRGRKHLRTFEWNGREHTCEVIPTYHPASLLYRDDPTRRGQVVTDLRMAWNLVFAEAEEHDYRILSTKKAVDQFTRQILKAHRAGKLGWVSSDIETDDVHSGNPNPWNTETNIMTVQFSWKERSGVMIPIAHPESPFATEEGIEFLQPRLKKLFEVLPICGQNFRFDATYLKMRLGIDVKNFVFDTRSANHFIHGGNEANDLESMAGHYLGWTGYKEDMARDMMHLRGSERHFGNVPLDRLLEYAVGDTDATLRLSYVLRDKIKEEGRLEQYERRYIFPWRFYLNMETNGTQVIPEEYRRLRRTYVPLLQGYLDQVKDSEQWKTFRKAARMINPKRFRKPRKKSMNTRRAECSRCGESWRINLGTKRQKKGEVYYVDIPFPDECIKCGAKASHIQTFIQTIPADPKDWWGFDQIEDEIQPKFVYPDDPPLNSPPKLAAFLYDGWGLPPGPDKKKPRSTDKAALKAASDFLIKKGREQDYDFLQVIRDYKRESKIYSSYIKNLPKHIGVRSLKKQVTDGPTQQFETTPGLWRVHYAFNTDSVRTGRISSAFHLLPKRSEVKAMYGSRFVEWARKEKRYVTRNHSGLILAGDYSQAEVRVMASESGDRHLIEAFARGDDIHSFVASMVFGKPPEEISKVERQVAKATTFALLYGGDEHTIYEHSRKGQEGLFYDLTVDKCRQVIEDYFGAFPGIKKYMDRQIRFARKHRYCESRTGFRRPLENILDENQGRREKDERISTNAPIQGSASDICQDSLARCSYAMEMERLKSLVFGFVHDSGEFDVYVPELPRLFEIIPYEMVDRLPERFPWLQVPFVADFELGRSWHETVDVEIHTPTHIGMVGNSTNMRHVIETIRKFWVVTGSTEKLPSSDPEKPPKMKVDLTLKRQRMRKLSGPRARAYSA